MNTAGNQWRSSYQSERVVYEFEDDDQLAEILDRATGGNWQINQARQPLFPTGSTHKQRSRRRNGVSALPFLLPHGDYGNAGLSQIERNFAKMRRIDEAEVAKRVSPRRPQNRRSRPVITEIDGDSENAQRNSRRQSYSSRVPPRAEVWSDGYHVTSTNRSSSTSPGLSPPNEDFSSRVVEVSNGDPFSDDFVEALVRHADKQYKQYISKSYGRRSALKTEASNAHPFHERQRTVGSYRIMVVEVDSDDEKTEKNKPKKDYNAVATTPMAPPPAPPPQPPPTAPSSSTAPPPPLPQQTVGPLSSRTASSEWDRMLRLHTTAQGVASNTSNQHPVTGPRSNQIAGMEVHNSPAVNTNPAVPLGSSLGQFGPFRGQVLGVLNQAKVSQPPPPTGQPNVVITQPPVTVAPTKPTATPASGQVQPTVNEPTVSAESKLATSAPLGFGTTEAPKRQSTSIPIGFDLNSNLNVSSQRSTTFPTVGNEISGPAKDATSVSAPTSGAIPVSVIPLNITSSNVDEIPYPSSYAGVLTSSAAVSHPPTSLPRPFDYGPFPQFNPTMIQAQRPAGTGPPIGLRLPAPQSVQTTNAVLNLTNNDRYPPPTATVVSAVATEPPKKESFLTKLKAHLKKPLFAKKRR